MPLETLLSEFWTYAHTQEYREGLFVEASGLVLDILLLIIGVKVIAYYLARQSRSTTNFASSFFIAQFLRDVLILQLKSGGVAEINSSLRAALKARKLDSLFSHFYYGNTENLLDLLRIRMRTGEHIAGHRILTPENRKDLAKEAQALLTRLDGLLVILASLRQEEQCLRAYEFRLVLTAVSDYLEDLSKSSGTPPPRTYAPMSTALASTVDSWFTNCKKVLDRQHKGQVRWSYARLLLSLPWVASYRFIIRRWRRFRGHPYTDPFSSNFPPLFCKSLEQALGTAWNKAVTASGIQKNDLHLMTTQHVVFSQDECIALLNEIRPFVPADIWNRVLAATLIADIDSRPISVITVDAAKANALYYLTRLSTKNDDTSDVIEQAFHSLWNLRPTAA
ncbi:MAG: hypothetical protein WC256_13940 [Desulfurivibrionaceae bacterium]|jgi:hypothetical protein